MEDFVLQCRAYGVGMILSSQYPSHFPKDISSSMATKIIHGNDGDTTKVKEIVQLLGSEGIEEDVARLGIFQAFLDNRHHRHTLIRTMNYPLYLVWIKLQELESSTLEELTHAEGLDSTKLSLEHLVHQLEVMGIARVKEGRVILLKHI
jgi:hypothetical protein